MRNLKNDKEAVVVAIGLFGLLILGIIVIVIASILSLMWGFSGFIGFVLLCISGYLLFMHKGKVKMQFNSPFAWCLVVGIILIFFSAVGLDIMPNAIDLRFVPWGSYSLNLL